MAKKKTTSRARKPRSAVRRKQRRSKPASRLLDVKEIQSLLKPPQNFEDLADKAIEAWGRSRATLRIPGFTPAALSRLTKRARQRQKVEQALRERLELVIKRAQHMRLVADDAAWKGVLKLWRYVKPVASENEQVRKAFRFLADALSRPRANAEKPEDQGPRAEPQPEATPTPR